MKAISAILLLWSFAMPALASIEEMVEYCQKDPNLNSIMEKATINALENDECSNIVSLNTCVNHTGAFPYWSNEGFSKTFYGDFRKYVDDNLAQCEKSCEDGNAQSCAVAGTSRIRGLDRQYEERDPLLLLQQKHDGLLLSMKACEGGEPIGCQVAVVEGKNFWLPKMSGISQAEGEKIERENWFIPSPINYAEMGCELDDGISCKMGYLLLKDYPNEVDHGDYDIEFFKNGVCKFGSKLDCRSVSK